jgi:hypothetical protein
MSFSNLYPYLHQWLSYGGTLSVDGLQPAIIRVGVGDGGGTPEETKFEAATVDEALALAEASAARWIAAYGRALHDLLAGEPMLPNEPFLWLPGHPRQPNPFFRKA